MLHSTSNNNGSTGTVRCNGRTYDISRISGTSLIDELKRIAREQGISKFDVQDGSQAMLEADQIISGNYTGGLTIVKYNAAA